MTFTTYIEAFQQYFCDVAHIEGYGFAPKGITRIDRTLPEEEKELQKQKIERAEQELSQKGAHGKYDSNWQAAYSHAWYFASERDDYAIDIETLEITHSHHTLESLFRQDITHASETPLAAFLGLTELDTTSELISHEEIESLLKMGFPQDSAKGRSLTPSQKEAVYKALNRRLSIVKGPPGTGKTETILHIVAIALHLGWKVAVVSPNNTAVENIVQKCLQRLTSSNHGSVEDDFDYACASKLAALGNLKYRRAFNGAHGLDKATGCTTDGEIQGFCQQTSEGREQHLHFDDFTSRYPFVTSTTHSIKRLFCDGTQKKYDLIIMDEASQADILSGIMAISSARRAVIVGDEKQLAPVTNEANQAKLSQLLQESGIDDITSFGDARPCPYDLSRTDHSFLEACYEVFAPDYLADSTIESPVVTMLTDHYRCHPSIITFCNEYVYSNQLICKGEHNDTSVFPISLLWYLADYKERTWFSEGKQERASSVNSKQLEVFRREELPYLKARLREDPNLKVCFLSPFNGQVMWLKELMTSDKELQELIGEDAIEQSDICDYGLTDGAKSELAKKHTKGTEKRHDNATESKIAPMPSTPQEQRPSEFVHEQVGALEMALAVREKKTTGRLKALTIHKAQGDEFDIVYLMPVEDGRWEWPWSQAERLVNVAVSRAIHELRILTSAKLMDAPTQLGLLGSVIPVKQVPNESNAHELFIQKLCSYVYTNMRHLETEGRLAEVGEHFGIKRSQVSSLFDLRPWVQDPRKKNFGSTRMTAQEFAPEQIIGTALSHIAAQHNLTVLQNVGFESLVLPNGKTLLDRLKWAGISLTDSSNWHFDFVLVNQAGFVLMAVEVDGDTRHRFATQTSLHVTDTDKARSIYLGFFGAHTQGNSSSATGQKLRDDGTIRNDYVKNCVVQTLCKGAVAHLGLDSTFTDRKLYFKKVREAYVKSYSQLQASLVWDVNDVFAREVTSPDDLEDSALTLLRIPCDGSTMFEVRDMPAGLINPAEVAFELPPTIDDYVERCIALAQKHAHELVRVDFSDGEPLAKHAHQPKAYPRI